MTEALRGVERSWHAATWSGAYDEPDDLEFWSELGLSNEGIELEGAVTS
jgi:hypothetical protein